MPAENEVFARAVRWENERWKAERGEIYKHATYALTKTYTRTPNRAKKGKKTKANPNQRIESILMLCNGTTQLHITVVS